MLKLVWQLRAIAISHDDLGHYHGEKGESFFSVSSGRGVACLLPWSEVPLTYIEDDTTGQGLKSWQSTPLRGVHAWQSTPLRNVQVRQSTPLRNVQVWQSTSLRNVQVQQSTPLQSVQVRRSTPLWSTFLTIAINSAEMATPCPRIIVRVPSHGTEIRWVIQVPLRVAAFVDPLPIMARERGSPEPAAWHGPELNSATST